MPTIGVMMGDRHGIGSEITTRFLAGEHVEDYGRAVLFADRAVADFCGMLARRFCLSILKAI